MVLDVIISTAVANSSICVPNADRIVEGLQVTSPRFADTPHGNASDSTISSTPLPDSHSVVKSASKTKLTFNQVVALAQKKAHESEVEQSLISSMPSDIGTRVLASSVYGSMVQAIKDGDVEKSDQLMGHLQELKDGVAKILELTTKNSELMTKNYELTRENNGLVTQMIKLQESLDAKQEEMKQLQLQALSQLSLLQNRVQAIMTQNYELHEYPIP
ncbi:hypothetical protein BGZ65_008106, partial [Modicella reniformis]